MPKTVIKSGLKSGNFTRLVRIRRFAQVTLPPALRAKFNLVEGDYLSAQATNEGILLRPSKVTDKQADWDKLLKIINRPKLRPGFKKQTVREAEEEIAEMIKNFRKQDA